MPFFFPVHMHQIVALRSEVQSTQNSPKLKKKLNFSSSRWNKWAETLSEWKRWRAEPPAFMLSSSATTKWHERCSGSLWKDSSELQSQFSKRRRQFQTPIMQGQVKCLYTLHARAGCAGWIVLTFYEQPWNPTAGLARRTRPWQWNNQ